MNTDRPLGSRYVLGSMLGRGSTGRVYAARRLEDNQELAVKVLREDWSDDDDVVRRLLRERRVLARLDHPNIIAVHDLVIDDGQAGIVMELVPGGTLRPLVRDGPMPADRVAALGRQLAQALAAAHAASVVHGDVKPENVLVAATDPLTVKLGDFGIARLLDATASSTSSRIGTPRYLSPELATGDPAGPAGDVYSLGVVLYEALAGRPPFTADSPVALWRAHADLAPPRPDAISDAWWTLLERMLAKRADRRPTAAEVAAALATGQPAAGPEPAGNATVIRKRRAAAPAAVPTAPAPRPHRRRLVVTGAAAGALLVIAGSVAWATWSRPPATGGAEPLAVVTAPSSGVIRSPAAAPGPTSAPVPDAVSTVAPATRTTTKDERRPTPVPKKSRTAVPEPPGSSTGQCQAASQRGGLDIGPDLNNSGGPNRVPAPCTAIWLRLTEVSSITYAKACLEDADGTDLRCGTWVYLLDGGAWNRLLDDVSPGARWQLYLKAEGPGRVGFDFSG
jgi:serine/threonine-protein kinase